jgi:hypothetical protein
MESVDIDVVYEQVMQSQAGLRRYSRDPVFLSKTSEEMREAIGLSPVEMDRAAHRLLHQNYPVHFEALEEASVSELEPDKDEDQHSFFNHPFV